MLNIKSPIFFLRNKLEQKSTKLKFKANFFYFIRFIHYIIILNVFKNANINFFPAKNLRSFFLSLYIFLGDNIQ